MGLITLTTDFGTGDWFVGAMKGVMISVSGRNRIVDITHEVPPGDIMAGAFALEQSYKYYPPNTIHVAIVDPGVGSDRPAIAVQTSNFIFVGPDNGVLSLALAKEKVECVFRIENEELFCKPVSRTFHGRDVFAPVAAHLGREASIEDVGSSASDFVRLPFPSVQIQGDLQIGQVIHIDRFGNCITNIPADSVAAPPAIQQVVLHNGATCDIKQFYNEVSAGDALAIIGSAGLVEIAVNGGHASEKLGLEIGSPVSLKID